MAFNLRPKIVNGLTWNLANLFVGKLLSILVRLLLAALIGPEHFGIAVLAIVFIDFSRLTLDFGLQSTIVRFVSPDRKFAFYHAANIVIFASSVAIAILLMLFSDVIAAVLGADGLSPLLRAMAPVLLIYGAAIVPMARLVKMLRFRGVFMAESSAVAISAIVAVAAAALGAREWSIAIQAYANAMVLVAVTWRTVRWRPRWRVRFAPLRPVVGYSMSMWGNQVVNFLRQNLDYVIVSAVVGTVELSFYSLAFMLSDTVRSQLSALATRTMFPIYSSIQQDREATARLYVTSTKFMALTVVPLSLSLAVIAQTLITMLFGAEWTPAIEPMIILSFAGVFFGFSGPTAEVLQAQDCARLLLIVTVGVLVVVALPLLYFLSARYGIAGAAAAMVVSQAVTRTITLVAVVVTLRMSFMQIVRAIYQPFLLLLVWAALFWFVPLSGLVKVLFDLVSLWSLFGLALMVFFVTNRKPSHGKT